MWDNLGAKTMEVSIESVKDGEINDYYIWCLKNQNEFLLHI